MAKPTLYRAEYATQARNYCLLGATEAELGGFFGTTDRTVRTWKRKHPEFAAAIAEGTQHANAQVVGALYTKAIAGDVGAIVWWTKNKMGWRDRVDHIAKIGFDPVQDLLNAVDGTGLKPKEA